MHRRNFFKSILATPLLTPLLLASKRTCSQAELFLIADTPHRFLPLILDSLPGHEFSMAESFTFLNTHPLEKDIKSILMQQDLTYTPDASLADVAVSFNFLRHSASPSFTFVRNQAVVDPRIHKLDALWNKMNKTHPPSSLLTVVSFKSPRSRFKGAFVRVYSGGQIIDRISLDKKNTRSYPVKQGVITACVENGKAWIADSSCSHKICVSAPPVTLAGERVICAPNRFFLEVEGQRFVDTVIGQSDLSPIPATIA